MAPSVLTAFAAFMRDHQYSTRMWEGGFVGADANVVCHELSVWFQSTFQVTGQFVVVWTQCTNLDFSGDCELTYVNQSGAYLVPNPFIEGDAEGFVSALMQIVNGSEGQLFPVQIRTRVLYNAV